MRRNRVINDDNIWAEPITDKNYKKLGGGYFDINNMMHLLNNKNNKTAGFIFYNSDNEAIGYACLAFRGGKEFHYHIRNADCFLFDFAVLEKHKRKGYGTSILEYLESYCQMNGKKNLSLAVKTDNIGAIQLYEKYGFAFIKNTRFIRFLKVDIPFLYA